jgi:transcriptional regulator with XRE-family HTH domain
MVYTDKNLSNYIRRIMRLKGLTQKDIEHRSNGGITGGYVASLLAGRAKNLSVEKLKALARGLDVEPVELFRVAGGLSADSDDDPKGGYTPDPLMILEIVQKAVASQEMMELLEEMVRLSPRQREVLLKAIRSLNASGRRDLGKARRA